MVVFDHKVLLGLILIPVILVISFFHDVFGILGSFGVCIFGISLFLRMRGALNFFTMRDASIIAAAFIIIGTVLASREREKEKERQKEKEKEKEKE